MKKLSKKNFLEWLSLKCEEIWRREGIWIEEKWNPEDLEPFFVYGDPYLYDIGIRDDDEIWRAYWTVILNIAYEISSSDLDWEFFADPGDSDGVVVVVVDRQGRCLTYDQKDGSVAKRLTMQDFGDIDGFRQFLIDTAKWVFSGGDKQ